jgi:CheY-like chemotaxis protein
MSTPLAGQPILVVEDELLVAMLLEDIIADLGGVVVGPASRIPQALELVQDTAIEMAAAILDVNLGGAGVFPVAEALKKRNVPFIFATGYGQGGLPEDWRNHPTLQKPFNQDQVTEALVAALRGGAAAEPVSST